METQLIIECYEIPMLPNSNVTKFFCGNANKPANVMKFQREKETFCGTRLIAKCRETPNVGKRLLWRHSEIQ